MNLIDGIGGVFLFSHQPKRLAEWYRATLGLDFAESPDCSSYYKVFAYRDLTNPAIERSTTWAILPAADDLTGKPRTGQINYRVQNMATALAHLRSNGVTIEKAEDFDYGKFAWLSDPEGNKIELFEEASASS